jgi:heme A synthase
MFNRDNAIGILLLALCTVVAGIMIYYISIGERPSLSVPPAVAWILGIVFVGLLLYGFVQGGLFRRLRGGQGGPQWPDPNTGRKSLWDRLRGK